jgi:hypothetical protein
MTYCCEAMRRQCEQLMCDRHTYPFDCPDVVMHHYESGWYGILIHDGGSSSYQILYCPWCGTGLPTGDAEDEDPNEAPDVRRIDVD